MVRSISSGLLLLALSVSAFAADVTGKWKGRMEATGRDVVFNLKCDGANVTGTMSGADSKGHQITKGKIEGDKISLTVASEWEGNPVTLEVNGTVSGDTIKMTIGTEDGSWSTEATVKKSSS